MKTSIISLVALGASLVAAQLEELENLPPCVQGCVGEILAGPNIEGCEAMDVKCLCGKEEFIGNMNSCVRSKCTQQDVDTAAEFAYNFCQKFGVTIDTSAPTATPAPSGTETADAPEITGNNTNTNVSTTASPQPSETGAGSALAVGGISIFGGALVAFLLL